MARRPVLAKKDRRQIDEAVARFEEEHSSFEMLADSLMVMLRGSPQITPYVHFLKSRVKDPCHLRRKLESRALKRKANGQQPDVDGSNVFSKITDLAGVRIIHLHTDQMADINRIILGLFDEHLYRVLEGPKAICWDLEYENLFAGFGIKTERRDSMYTSVHYIVKGNQRTPIAAEVQVRTLMDEVWGEVSHRVDYPESSPSVSCQEQLKVLARLTTGCTRLVDSIFRTHSDSLRSERDDAA